MSYAGYFIIYKRRCVNFYNTTVFLKEERKYTDKTYLTL